MILKWLQEEYDCEVVTFTADLGQGEELEPARKKAEAAGVKEIFIDDLREEFVRWVFCAVVVFFLVWGILGAACKHAARSARARARARTRTHHCALRTHSRFALVRSFVLNATSDYVWPMFRANATYEGIYLLGTSIARPLIAKRQIEIAKQVGADAVSHGATGKGNDQVRFELGYYALKPDIQVIAPWREWDLNSRTRLISYAESNGLEVPQGKRGEPPYSMDANLLHISYEGLALEDPWVEAKEDIYTRSVSPEAAPDEPEYVEIEFAEGDPVAINGARLSPAAMLTELNRLGGKHGIGRIDIVESRFVGMKSRGVYETPGGTILINAHRAIESICLDRGEMHLKDELMPKYAELLYNGFWFSPEREALQAAIDMTQRYCTGMVRLKLYKGNVMTVGRKAATSLYDDKISSFEDDGGTYDQTDAAGFIKLQALRLRTLARKRGY